MSDRLAISATASVLAMSVFALFAARPAEQGLDAQAAMPSASISLEVPAAPARLLPFGR